MNNSLGFPGIFRGALDVRARDINRAMKEAVATAAMQGGAARVHADPDVVAENARSFIYEGKLGLVA